jgi:Asparagine synthase
MPHAGRVTTLTSGSDIFIKQRQALHTDARCTWRKRELAPLLRRLLAPDVLRARGLFRVDAVERLLSEHQANRIDGTDPSLALMHLESWSRMYLDGREAGNVAAELHSLDA